MQNNSIRKAIIYTRVSTDEQAENGFSLPHQKEALEKYCESHSIKILKHYQEDASGKDFNRPAFIQLFEYAKVNKKEVDAIIFTRWDRFSRNLEESLKYKRLFNVMGITLMSIDQVLDNTVPESKMMFAVLNVVAEIERDKISIRTREGVRRANVEGYFTNRPPVGYKRVKINGNKPSIEPDENAPLIRQIFDQYSTGVFTVEDIRKIYWKKGIKRCYQGMQELLSNVTYNGKIRLREFNQEEEQIIMALHQPIIDDLLFEKVQRVLYGRKWKMNFQINRSEIFPLRGHLKCSICGRNITGSKCRSRSGKIFYYYHCQDTCPERFRVDHAHESLKKYLKSLTIMPEVKQAYMAFMQQVFVQKEGSRENEIRIFQAKIQRNRDLINAAEDKFLQDQIDAVMYKKAKARYEEEIDNMEVELKTLKESETEYMKYLRESLSLLENLDYHYENATWEERQKLLKVLFPDKLFYKNHTFINPSTEGIVLLVTGVKEFVKEGASGQSGSADMKVLKKLGRVG